MAKQKIITIDLVRELFRKKDGKILNKDTFAQNDAMALMQILSYYNSMKGTFHEFQIVLSLHDKVKKAWVEDSKKLEMTLSEVSFLKDYLENFNERSAPISSPDGINQNKLSEFRLRTLVSVVKQLS